MPNINKKYNCDGCLYNDMCQVKNTQLHIIHTLDNYSWDYKSTILKYIQIKKKTKLSLVSVKHNNI